MPRNPEDEPKSSTHETRKNEQSEKRHKRSPGRPKIPLDRIIDAALEIIDTQGIDALSMRSIAQHLDSGTATLYRHFSGRTELIGLVVDRIMAEATPARQNDANDDWQTVLASSARSMYAILNRHRGIATLLMESMPDGPNSMEFRERLLGLLLSNGFSTIIASRAFATISRFVLGFAIQYEEQSKPDANQQRATSEFQKAVDSKRYPALQAAAAYLPVSLDDEFEFGLGLILSGLSNLKEKGA
ncbi:AcrR family transcriptional regulator [Agrobacterium vitis]|nr:AcrR family transcriptional regulator [Agrobacterium vitis]MBE1440352.1 AcrR family transcriptional regulator [Agrobacterium vitis]